MAGAGLIGVDWGTSNLRAFRYGPDGAVLETRRAASGLGAVKDRDFEGALNALIGDWLIPGRARVVISGMAGAREGWIEAPYVRCPATLSSLAAAMIAIPTEIAEAYMVPGLVAHETGAARGIMRGEETQIFGVIDAHEAALVIAPGTHSKWARIQIQAEAVAAIATFMTGEVYALMRTHSILARLIEGDAEDEAAFMLGVERARADDSLLRLLFTARTEGLFGAVAPTAMASYLSGLMIGSEVRAGAAGAGRDETILLVGAEPLAALYKAALGANGRARVETIDGEAAAARGLWRIAAAKGLA